MGGQVGEAGWAGDSVESARHECHRRHPSRQRHAPVPLHGRSRSGHRGALAGQVGRRRHLRLAEPRRATGRCDIGSRPAKEVHPRHVPVPQRRRTAHGPPPWLHRHRHLCPLSADDRPQRAVHDGLRRLRSARRAVRRADRPAPGYHHQRQHRQHAPPTAPPRAQPRPPPQHQHHRPRLLPLDPVDLPPNLQRLVRPRAEQGAPRRRSGRRTRRRHPRREVR